MDNFEEKHLFGYFYIYLNNASTAAYFFAFVFPYKHAHISVFLICYYLHVSSDLISCLSMVKS
ncbi:hypothetical protein X975_08610, partial [Stegodyphus mimosarum]